MNSPNEIKSTANSTLDPLSLLPLSFTLSLSITLSASCSPVTALRDRVSVSSTSLSEGETHPRPEYFPSHSVSLRYSPVNTLFSIPLSLFLTKLTSYSISNSFTSGRLSLLLSSYYVIAIGNMPGLRESVSEREREVDQKIQRGLE